VSFIKRLTISIFLIGYLVITNPLHSQLYSIGGQHYWQISNSPSQFAGIVVHRTSKMTELGSSLIFGFSKKELNLKANAYSDIHFFEFHPTHFGGHMTPFLGLQYESRIKQALTGQDQKVYHKLALRLRVGLKFCYDRWNLTTAYQPGDGAGVINSQFSYTLYGGHNSRFERIHEWKPLQRFSF